MPPLQLSIIVPTFREVENLPVLIPRLDAATTQAGIACEILVIDDNSRDGTEELCQRLSQQHPVKLLVRTDERGLSSAVLAGMKIARGEVLIVMDADLSHPPEKVPELYAALQSGTHDFVIGSRYVKGGGTSDDWGWFRWLNSKVATLLAWPLTSVSDPMAGFFGLTRQAYLEHVGTFDPIGYKIGLELLVKCGCRQPTEVPIFFADRLHGESKLSLKEQLNYLRHLHRLYEFRYRELLYFTKFAAVGASGMLVDLGCFLAALSLFPPAVARGVAIWVAMTWNFGGNRMLTFRHARHDDFWTQYVQYCLSCLLGAAVNWGASVGIWNTWPGSQSMPWVPALAGVIAGTGFNYVLCRKWVFGGNKPQSTDAKSDTSSKPRSQMLNAA